MGYTIFRYLIVIFLVGFLVSCKAKKVYVETHSTDTIYKSEIIKFTPKQLNELVINTPCDSLGVLKPFFYTLGTKENKLTVKTVNNTIYIEQDLDSIRQSAIKEFQKSVKTSEEIIEVEVIPSWIWKILIVSLLLNLLFIFRKNIPIIGGFL